MEGEAATDFDPLTDEGGVDINEPLTEDEYTSLIPRPKDNYEPWGRRVLRRTGQKVCKLLPGMWANRKNLLADSEMNIEMINREIRSEPSLEEASRAMPGEATDEILRLFPDDAKTGEFFSGFDDKGLVVVKLTSGKPAEHRLLKANGELNSKLPKGIKDQLGPSITEITENNDVKIAQNDAAIQKARRIVEDPNASQADKVAARERIPQLEQENETLGERTEALEERMTTWEKVKRIWKKNGPLSPARLLPPRRSSPP
ncbi:hypothetical protein QZH41_005574 [Actinostola sp. cb2023]|nr:hypothetical protein QZH41_005574 [Actinostola sp. cb2023]